MNAPKFVQTIMRKIEETMSPITSQDTSDKKHIKKLKPVTSQPAHFGPGNGGSACPPIGGDIVAGTK